MKKNLLTSKIVEIQEEYLSLLQGITFSDSCKENIANVIDSINIFWHANRESIDLFLQYNIPECECYLYTGNGSFSLDKKMHYVFTTLGSMHILDDPISMLSKNIANFVDGKYKEKAIDSIVARVKDIKEVLKNHRKELIVLPITSFTSSELENVTPRAEELFFQCL